MGKVLPANELVAALKKERSAKVVFTNGCFDLLHVGHVRYLAEAKSLGDLLVVAINTDESVKKLKGAERPIQNENDRAEILAALESVDYVTFFSEDTPKNLIEKIKPHVLVKGGDWPVDKIEGSAFVIASGGTVKSLKFVNGKSTTSIVEKMKKN